MSEPTGHHEKNGQVRDSKGVFVTKLNDEVTDIVATAIQAGVSLETAAKYAGISRATLHQWLLDGRRAIQRAGDPENVEEEYQRQARFVARVDDALASFKINLTGAIMQAGREQWQANAWLLERRFPDEYGRRQRIEHGNADGAPFMVAPTPVFDPSKLTDEELREAQRLLSKARPDGLRAPQPSGPHELRATESGEG